VHSNLQTGMIVFMITLAILVIVLVCRERPSIKAVALWVLGIVKTCLITIVLFAILVGALNLIGWIVNSVLF
jgi:hypothetical protein